MRATLGRFAIMVGLAAVLASARTESSFAQGPRGAQGAPVTRIESVVLDGIELSGVTALSQLDVDGSVVVSIGESYDSRKLARSVENLQTLYRARGYYEVQIRTELVRRRVGDRKMENVLQFLVNEGLATRVAGIQLRPLGFEDDSARRNWESVETEMADAIPSYMGEIFDQERTKALVRQLKDALAAEEFIGSKVMNIEVEPTAQRTGEQDRGAAARWVNLIFQVDLGDRVSFGFRGNSVLTHSDLLVQVREQRSVGFGKDYVGAIQARILEAYRALGYSQVQAQAFTFEKGAEARSEPRKGRHVTYAIEEGPRTVIDEVVFDGNLVFDSAKLRQQFFANAPRMIQRKYYVSKEAQHAAELLVEYLKSEGYLSAKLVTVSASYLPPRAPRDAGIGAVKLTVYLYEGEQTVIRKVKISGNQALGQGEILQFLNVADQAPLNLFAFTSGIEELKAAYRGKGYLGMALVNEGSESVVRYEDENRVADVMIEIDEGPQFKASRIEIEGLSTTRSYIVERELRFAVGDVLEEEKIRETESRLRKLGVFAGASVQLSDDPDRTGFKVVKVLVQEGEPGVLEGGVGLRNDLGVRLFGKVGYSNLWHRNHAVSLTGSVNRRFVDFHFGEYQFELSYDWPWFVAGETTFRPSINVDRLQYRTFDASSESVSLTLERRLLRQTNLKGSLTYSLENVNQFFALDERDIGPQTIGGITPALKLDLRDNPLHPRSGLFASSSFEVASPYLLSQAHLGYTRFQFRTDYYLPLGTDVTWFLSFRTGFERSIEAPIGIEGDPDCATEACQADRERFLAGSIPRTKLFALGGVSSIRGFEEQAINEYEGKLIRALSYVNYRTQIDFPLAYPMMMGLFVDAGNLSVDRYSLGNLRYGYGGGIHYITPVGSISLDLGINPDPRKYNDPGRRNEDAYQFYFYVGTI